MGPGVTLVHGGNGQGKSNLLEAVYMLVIGKSSRTSTEKDLVRIQPITVETHTQVAAEAERADGTDRITIGFRVSPPETAVTEGPPAPEPSLEVASVHKYVRVNGLPRRVADLVGLVNGVMFGAQDLELVYGSPSSRRRYLDIINSQLDSAYLRSLQRYQRVLKQRNHLLKSIRAGRAPTGELALWDRQLAEEGAYVMLGRRDAVRGLSDLAKPIHVELAGGVERLDVEYLPSVPVEECEADAVAARLADTLSDTAGRDVAAGVTRLGPHRDDARILVDGRSAAAFASRGQARTATLAVKLAEARYLTARSRSEPLLLLDDVLSELDPTRRAMVLDHVSRYEQCLITTADPDAMSGRLLEAAASYEVRAGSRAERPRAFGIIRSNGGLPIERLPNGFEIPEKST